MATVLSKVDEISQVLRTEILQGQYRAGERLPSERELASRFESNRGAIREALKRLEQMGIAEITRGGVRVLPVEDANLEVIGHLLELGDDATKLELMGQILAVLGSMMALSARSAINQGTDQQLEEIAGLISQLIEADDPGKREECWMALGEKLMSVHHNLVLRLVGNSLRTQFIGKVTEMDAEPDLDHAALHQELVRLRDAVIARDPRAASAALTHHFQIIINGINALSQPGEPAETLRNVSHV